MRTSNKIILGIFTVPLLILTLIHVSLYAKYKSGSYTVMNKVVEDRFTRTPLKNISQVKIYGLTDFNVIPADTSKLEIEKDTNGQLQFTINGDTLIIDGTKNSKSGAKRENERSYEAVNLYLPSSANIVAENSDVAISGNKDSLKSISYQVSLTGSGSFRLRESWENGKKPLVYFKDLSVRSSGASVEFTDNARIAMLQLNLLSSNFNDNGATIDKLSVTGDAASSVTMKADNLGRMNAGH